MVLFLFSHLVRAQDKSLGPVFLKLELGQDNTVGEAIEIIRKNALKMDRLFAFSVELQKHELDAPFPSHLSLKKVPAAIALFYISDICRLDYTFKNSLWVIRTRAEVDGQDEVQMIIRNITDAEYKALGLKFDQEIGLVTDDGKKWPSGEIESTAKIENHLIIRALPEKIENLKALLRLHRAGYPIPKINSQRKK
ncbi:MAG: hypothetical protein ABF379_09320 [Akkermansiaceae bacterium]